MQVNTCIGFLTPRVTKIRRIFRAFSRRVDGSRPKRLTCNAEKRLKTTVEIVFDIVEFEDQQF